MLGEAYIFCVIICVFVHIWVIYLKIAFDTSYVIVKAYGSLIWVEWLQILEILTNPKKINYSTIFASACVESFYSHTNLSTGFNIYRH